MRAYFWRGGALWGALGSSHTRGLSPGLTRVELNARRSDFEGSAAWSVSADFPIYGLRARVTRTVRLETCHISLFRARHYLGDKPPMSIVVVSIAPIPTKKWGACMYVGTIL